jgi:hypothetical protein
MALLVVAPLWGYRLAAQDEEQSAPPAAPAQEQPEVLSRGPVHEAFAEPVNLELQAGLVAPDRPPPNVEEIPPADRPQGQQFAWIPGYWSWDADRRGYIWVSACWRAAPPRMSWVPGYWSEVPGGWEWIAGFWTPAGVQELEYLPVPPTVVDVDPPGDAPSPDTMWVPPCMYWSRERYVRRAGYWLTAQPNWVWVPSHYVATPRGYVFAAGHWDYSLERRGMLFAPVYLSAAVYGRPHFIYSPSVVIDVGLLRVNLFAYPRYSHYYFGDYYDDAYLSVGIYPWFDSRRLHSWYDPVHEYDRWQNRRSEPRWEKRERDEYDRRRADKDLRPARTYHEQESRLARLPEPQRRAFQVAQPITVAVTRRETPLKFTRLDTNARQKIARQAADVRTFRDERNRWEATAPGSKAAQASAARRAPVKPPAARRETTAPPRERKEATMPPERKTSAPPPERKEVAPPADRKTSAPPPERKEVAPPAERKKSAPPPERKEVAPPADRKEDTPRAKRQEDATPTARREAASAPARAPSAPRTERVQIPRAPVVGGSGAPGIFRKGAPSRPTAEDKDETGKGIRNTRARDRETPREDSERGRD